MAASSSRVEALPAKGSDDARGGTGPVVRGEKSGDDVIASRVNRFVDVGIASDVFKSPSLNKLNNLKPFYNGMVLDSRMAEIRKSINYIRQHWSEYDIFMAGLKELLIGDNSFEFKDVTARSLSENLLSTPRDWLQAHEATNQILNYEAIKLYTSEEGQNKMYRVGYNIFRNEDSVAVVEMIRSVVFLVELLNIDLFNLCLNRPDKKNFVGVVYRGLCLSEGDFEAFKSLRDEPINRRNIAIPLGLLSASSSKQVAEKFIRIQLKKNKDKAEAEKREPDNLQPLLIKTHVINLKQEYVDYYSKSFPSTLLTTICAVDIHDISLFPEELEVLLRGPFFLILDLHKEKHDVPGGECYVLETVMLNANRDHISTSLLGEDEGPARIMFSTMVAVTRSEFALKYCESHDLLEDAEEYRQIMNENLIKLDAIMNK